MDLAARIKQFIGSFFLPVISSQPLVSIITPSYNQRDFIEETILSVISQSYDNIEHIIVDGCSTDGTQLILDKYSDRVDTILVEPDEGQSDAINKGLTLSNGSILMWLNSDDILLSDSVAQAVDIFQHNQESLMIHGHCELFGPSIKPQLIGFDDGGFMFKYPAYMAFPQPASFFRRSLIDQTGLLDESLHYGMDFDLTVRAFLLGDITYHPNLVARYRIHSSSKTNDLSSFVSDWRIVFSRFINTYPLFSEWKSSLMSYHLHCGTNHSYAYRREISEDEFQLILYTHLFTSAHLLYQSGDDTGCRNCIRFLKKYLPNSYSEGSLYQLKLRSYFPRFFRDFYHNFFK